MPFTRLVLLSGGSEKSPGVGGMGIIPNPRVSRDAPRSQSFPHPGLLSSGAGGEFCRDCVKHLWWGFLEPQLPSPCRHGWYDWRFEWMLLEHPPRWGWWKAHTFNRSGGEQREGTSLFWGSNQSWTLSFPRIPLELTTNTAQAAKFTSPLMLRCKCSLHLPFSGHFWAKDWSFQLILWASFLAGAERVISHLRSADFPQVTPALLCPIASTSTLFTGSCWGFTTEPP